MEEITNWSQLFFESLRAFGQTMMTTIPSIIGAILILLIGWLFAKMVSGAILRIFTMIKVDTLAEQVKASELLERANIQSAPSVLIGKFIYWVLILLVITTAADTLGWTVISEEISKLLGYLPSLLSAIIFFTVGVYIATFVRDFIQGATKTLGISTGRVISSFVFYLLFLLVSLTSLDQAGIDTSIITSNLLLIIGAVMAAAAISYGFASRAILANILGSFFNQRIFAEGQTIEIDGQQGKIIGMTNVSVTLQLNEKEKLVIPANQLTTKQIKIIDQ